MIVPAFLGGIAAGLAAAVPLGAIGVLVVDRGLRRGLAVGLAAAAGVATVDAVYAGVAVTVGAGLQAAVADLQGPASLVAAAVLGALGAFGVRDALRSHDGPSPDEQDRAAAQRGRGDGGRRALGTYAAFVGLTSLNPATVLTFAAVAVAAGERLATTATRVVFVAGVGLASAGWQALLALAGAALGRRPRPALQRATRLVGALLLLGLAGALVVDVLA